MPKVCAVSDRVQCLARGHEVVGDLGRMNLQPESHALRVEHVEDRPPTLGEVLVPALDRGEVVRREGVDEMPDRRAGEPVHLCDAELRRGTCGVLHALRGARANTFLLSVAVDLRRQDRAVSRVDHVADGLADQVGADRPDTELVALEQLAPAACVAAVGDRPVDLEMVSPAGKLEPVEPPARAARSEVCERQVGPLAGEQCARTGHRLSVPFIRGRRSRDARGLT